MSHPGAGMTNFFEGALLPDLGAGRAEVFRTPHLFTGKFKATLNRPRPYQAKIPVPRTKAPPIHQNVELLWSLPKDSLKELGLELDMNVVIERVKNSPESKP